MNKQVKLYETIKPNISNKTKNILHVDYWAITPTD